MLVRRIRSRGANIVVEAHGEVLFAPGMELDNWKRRFSNRITSSTEAAAPSNKRPRWGHYDKPLKRTITSSTSTRIVRGGGYFYIAVGSTAPHAYYVDQGTGIHAGGSPYPARILPPWQRGSASLYEATWRPIDRVTGEKGNRVSPVMIKGQKGQFFFDKGLTRGFQKMRLRSYQVPGEGVSGLSSAMNTFPSGLANFAGNTPYSLGFQASLDEWRTWRDAAWEAGEGLGRGGGIGSRAQAAFREKAQAAAEAKSTTKTTGPMSGPMTNKAAYLASKAAAAKRKQKQLADLAEQKRRKAEGEKKRRDKEQQVKEAIQKRAKARQFETARKEAYQYANAIRPAYPNVEVLVNQSKGIVRVRWSDSTGQVHKQDFA